MTKIFKLAQLLAVFVALALVGGAAQAQEKYEKGGIAGLESEPRGGMRGDVSPKVEAAGQLIGEIKSADPDAGVGKVQGELARHGHDLVLARRGA